jgi:membrane associated rhomboid family serine protease
VIPLRDANPVRRTPIITIATIVACVAVFAYTLWIEARDGLDGVEHFFETWGVVPAQLVAAWKSGDYLGHETLTVFTSMFLHVNLIHLAGNMIYLWIFGFYLAGGIAAVVPQVLIDPTSEVPMVGASGAISAVLGAYLVLFPGARILSLVFLGFFYQLIEVRAVFVLGFWFLLQLVDGIASLGLAGAEGGVAFFAHIGGFVAGAAFGLLVRGTLAGRGRLSGLPRAGVG